MNRLSACELIAFFISTITTIITITNTEIVPDTNAGIECLHLDPDFATLADIGDEERWKTFSAECLVKGSSVTHRGRSTGVACKKRICGGGHMSLEPHCLIQSRLNDGVTEVRFGCESGGTAPLQLAVDKVLIDGRSAYLSCATTDCNMLKARKEFAKQLRASTATTDTTTRSKEGGGLKTGMDIYIISGMLAVVALMLFGSIVYIIMRRRKKLAKQEAMTGGEEGEKKEGDKDVEKAVVGHDGQAGEKPEAQPVAENMDKSPENDAKVGLEAQAKPAKKEEEGNKENENKEGKEEEINDESKADQQSGKSATGSNSGSGSEVSSRGKMVLAEKAEAAKTMYSPTSSLLRVTGTQAHA